MRLDTTPRGRWLVACDLDQTLIYSRAAFRLPAHEEEPPLRLVEWFEGRPLSYVTAAADEALLRLADEVPVVPVTTRTLAQYARVDLGFVPPYAIAANGGHLLIDGVRDREWEAGVRRRLAGSGLAMTEVLALARQAAREPWVGAVRDADDFFVYLVATERAAIPDLRDLTTCLAAGGWTVSVQGRKVYLVPAALTKEAALREVIRRTGANYLAAAGDSLLDQAMLAMADAAFRPAHGELHDQQVHLPNLAVTSDCGVLAGEQIVAGLARAVEGAALSVEQL